MKLCDICPDWIKNFRPQGTNVVYVKIQRNLDLQKYQLRDKITSYMNRSHTDQAE